MMELKVLEVAGTKLLGTSFPDGRFVLVDVEADTVVLDVRLPGDCRNCFDISPDGKRLATGYLFGPTYALDVWDVQSLTRLAKSRKVPLAVTFGPEVGHLLVYPSTAGATYLWDYETDTKRKLPWAESPCNGIRDTERGEYLLHTTKRGQALLVKCIPFSATALRLPIKGTIYRMERSPKKKSMVAIDGDGYVYYLSYPEYHLLWRERVDGFNWVCYSGDGRFLAVAIQEGENYTTQVLSTKNGKRLRSISSSNRCEYPWFGSQTMSLAGEFIDLASGKIRSGVSKKTWWRSRLRAKPTVLH